MQEQRCAACRFAPPHQRAQAVLGSHRLDHPLPAGAHVRIAVGAGGGSSEEGVAGGVGWHAARRFDGDGHADQVLGGAGGLDGSKLPDGAGQLVVGAELQGNVATAGAKDGTSRGRWRGPANQGSSPGGTLEVPPEVLLVSCQKRELSGCSPTAQLYCVLKVPPSAPSARRVLEHSCEAGRGAQRGNFPGWCRTRSPCCTRCQLECSSHSVLETDVARAAYAAHSGCTCRGPAAGWSCAQAAELGQGPRAPRLQKGAGS